MKIFLKIILMTFIFFSTTFSKDGDGREIIKAYEKGKPAKMDIEITKVKTYGEIDLKVDEKNKKIYTEIKEPQKILSRSYRTEGKRELIITENIDEITKESLTNEYNYRITDKGQIEIDYNEIPRSLYFWVMSDNSKKLYKGNIRTISDLIVEKDTYMYVFEREKVSEFINGQTYAFKIGRVTLNQGVTLEVIGDNLTVGEKGVSSYQLSHIEGGSEGNPIPSHGGIKYKNSEVEICYKRLGEDGGIIEASFVKATKDGETYEIIGVLPQRFTNEMDYELLNLKDNNKILKMKLSDGNGQNIQVLEFKNYKIKTETFNDPQNQEPSGGTIRLYIPHSFGNKTLTIPIGNAGTYPSGVYDLGVLHNTPGRAHIKVRDSDNNSPYYKISGGAHNSGGLIFGNEDSISLYIKSGEKNVDEVAIPLLESGPLGMITDPYGQLIIRFYSNYFSVNRLDIDFGHLFTDDIMNKKNRNIISAESKAFSKYDGSLKVDLKQGSIINEGFYLENEKGDRIDIIVKVDETIEDVRRGKVVAIIPTGQANVQPGFYSAKLTMSIVLDSIKGGKF